MDWNLSKTEVGLIRYYRSLDKRIKAGLYLWLLTGDATLLTHRLRQAA